MTQNFNKDCLPEKNFKKNPQKIVSRRIKLKNCTKNVIVYKSLQTFVRHVMDINNISIEYLANNAFVDFLRKPLCL